VKEIHTVQTRHRLIVFFQSTYQVMTNLWRSQIINGIFKNRSRDADAKTNHPFTFFYYEADKRDRSFASWTGMAH